MTCCSFPPRGPDGSLVAGDCLRSHFVTPPSRPIGVALLGATGSIGNSTLRVLERQRDRFVPVALTANGNVAALAEQVARIAPAYVGLVQA
ncbi:MAG: hypothetical protein ACK6DP_10425, partial [Gemmatimonas sp.]